MRYVFVVMYFVFVICLSAFAVVITIVVLHMYLRADSNPVVAMPGWVSLFLIFYVLVMRQHARQLQYGPLKAARIMWHCA